MHRDQRDELWQKLEHWIGDSEAANWTEYTTEMVAKGVLIDFTATQWALLDQTLLSKPEYWQQRCTVSLGEDRSAPAIALLKRLLLESAYLDVRILAIYELDWCETPIERKYAPCIEAIIQRLPVEEIEPELKSLLAKAETAAQ